MNFHLEKLITCSFLLLITIYNPVTPSMPDHLSSYKNTIFVQVLQQPFTIMTALEVRDYRGTSKKLVEAEERSKMLKDLLRSKVCLGEEEIFIKDI